MSKLHADRADEHPRAHPAAAATPAERPPALAPDSSAADPERNTAAPEQARTAPHALTPETHARGSSHWLAFALTAGVVVVLDQITKRFIDRNLPLGDSWPEESWPVRILHVKNTGAAFSMLQNQTLFLTLMSVVGLAAIILYFRFRPSDHPLLRLALALQLGGAIGNLIDRARYGHVTDFIKVPHWPVFNVADSAISVGVATVVLFLLFSKGDSPREAAER